MNREIKFRGKSLVNYGYVKEGDWIYGGIVFHNNNIWITVEHLGVILVEKETVGQYTGLHDKNRKEIYERRYHKIKKFVN